MKKVQYSIDNINMVYVKDFPDDATDEQIRDDFMKWFDKMCKETKGDEVWWGSWEYI